MKKRVIYLFALILYLLVACTVLSDKIQEEMATQVQVLLREPISNSTGSITLDPLFYRDGVSFLYEVTDGSGWRAGQRSTAVPDERWDYEMFGQFLHYVGGRDYLFVETGSRHPKDGGLVQVLDTFETGNDQYLLISSGEMPAQLELPETWSVSAQLDNAMLLEVRDGVYPFFEHRAKLQTGIPQEENTKIFSLTEARAFLEQLPGAAFAAVLLVVPILLWAFSDYLLTDPQRYKLSLTLNIVLTVFALVGLLFVLKGFDFPASMMPQSHIFDFAYYRQTYQSLFDSLRAMGDTSLWSIAQKIKTQVLLIFAAGAVGFVGIAVMEIRLTPFGNRWMRNWLEKRQAAKKKRK